MKLKVIYKKENNEIWGKIILESWESYTPYYLFICNDVSYINHFLYNETVWLEFEKIEKLIENIKLKVKEEENITCPPDREIEL